MQFHFLWVLPGQQYPKAEITRGDVHGREEEEGSLGEGVPAKPRPLMGGEGGSMELEAVCAARPREEAQKRFPRWWPREGGVTGVGGGEDGGRGPRAEVTWREKALRSCEHSAHWHL